MKRDIDGTLIITWTMVRVFKSLDSEVNINFLTDEVYVSGPPFRGYVCV